MAFNDLEFHAAKKEVALFVEDIRQPVAVRNELDIYYLISEQSIEIGESRLVWRGKPDEKVEHPSAKISYIRSQKIWKIYWMRSDMKWHEYDSAPTLKAALEMVSIDAHGCFFG